MCDRFRKVLCKLTPVREDGKMDEEPNGLKNILAFYVFGILTFFNQEMIFTASEDLLSGKMLPTSIVLAAFVTPILLTKLILPWFVEKIPYIVKTLIISFLMCSGVLLIVFVENTKVKLLGISMNAVATGGSEIVFLALTSCYSQVCISAFVAGTGMASLLAPLYYTGLTTWSCVSPKTTVLISVTWPIFYLVFYAILDKEPIEAYREMKTRKRENVRYKVIDSASDDGISSDDEPGFKCPYQLRFGEKLRIALKIMPFIIPLFIAFFAEYLSMTSILTTIAFPNSHVLPRDHYQYYSLAYRVGKFVGRSYLFIFSCFSEAVSFLKFSKTWIFAVINLGHLILFLFEAWYHFVWYLWIIILLCSTLGLSSGMIVLLSSHAAAEVLEPEEKEFAFGLLTIGNALGSFTASLLGLFVEPYLQRSCVVHFASYDEFCFTRNDNSTGWTHNLHCSMR